MNILFLSISSLPHISEHSISLDLIHEFRRNGHEIYIVCGLEKKENKDTFVAKEDGCSVLRVRIGNNKKANLIEKGLTTLFLPYYYISAIKKYYANIKFDLVLYPTPPITQVKTVKYIKRRDGAKSFLLLKDIFPQNAVDMQMLSTHGLKSLLYRFFRNEEKQLYKISDYIGCMSQANVDYVLKNNPEIAQAKIGVCPNSIEVYEKKTSEVERSQIKEKYLFPNDKKIFVYGGNLGKPQGIDFLIECLKSQQNNTNVFFVIVGDGTEYAKLERYVNQDRPANVKLMKRLPKEEYDTLVNICDVGMIFLDYRFTIPNFPSRMLSYLQAQKPILVCTDESSDMGKIAEENKFGWYAHSNDVNAFVKCMDMIEAENLVEYGKNGFAFLKGNYDVAISYKKIMDEMYGA